MGRIWSYSFRHFEKKIDIKTSEMLSFLPLENNSVTMERNCLLD